MKFNVQAMRKRAGFKSAKAFALYAGINPNTYTDYEQGRINLTLDKAWELADEFHCSLDELAGRTAPEPKPADLRKARMMEDYDGLSEAGKDAAAAAVGGIRDGERSRIVAEGDETDKAARRLG